MIFLEESKDADYKMRIFNVDGSEAEMCGNGIRCLMAFIHYLEPSIWSCRIETMHAVIPVEMQKEMIKAAMPFPLDIHWGLSFDLEGSTVQADYLNTGVPHAILFVEDLEKIDVEKIGRMVRFHSVFGSKGTNANFAQWNSAGYLSIRTYERGVEQETLACGTGATAAAIAAARRWELSAPVTVRTRSGQSMSIDFSWEGHSPMDVSMSGPAHRVFHGCIELSNLLY